MLLLVLTSSNYILSFIDTCTLYSVLNSIITSSNDEINYLDFPVIFDLRIYVSLI